MKKQEKNKLIRCSCCGFPLIKQKYGKTRKTMTIQRYVDGQIRSSEIEIGNSKKPFDIEDVKIPFIIKCPKCRKATSLYLFFGKLNGITFSFKEGATEIIDGKQIEIAKREEKKIRDVYLNFEK